MVAEGGKTGQLAQVRELPLVVGRGSKADLRLEDARVSRSHCSFERRDGEVALRDLRSLNGTWLNGRRVSFEVVKSGDRIRVGHTVLIYFDDGGGLDAVFAETVERPGRGPAPDESETRAEGLPTLA